VDVSSISVTQILLFVMVRVSQLSLGLTQPTVLWIQGACYPKEIICEG
jgi:hypothetical protein